MAYDYHAHTESVEESVKIAKRLSLSGLCLAVNWTNQKDLDDFKQSALSFEKESVEIPKKTDRRGQPVDIFVGLEIKDKPHKLKDLARLVRKKTEVLMVHGGDLEVNRAALETPEVDILLHPEMGREDSGLDHIMVKLAKKNNVAIEFGLNDVIYAYKKTRARILNSLIKNADLVRKYKAPFVITSGAFSEWDLRSPSELLSFGRFLGFKDPEIKKALSNWIVKENRKRLSGNWIMPGVELESGGSGRT